MKMLNKHIINIRESMHLDRSKFTSLLLDSIYSLEEEKRREEKRREEKRREEKRREEKRREEKRREEKRREEKRRITHSQNFQPVVGAI